ncbi:serine hydrolase [Aliivibrio sp. 1S128]|uniref:serine hydrolase domain-containing protein n=1 Tax=Aliivibrio sp. 1S128 TaxID=1840085 RepID=UPI0009F245FD|nr:serine hydrolase [Aliivibrio sp. 1S128]
MKITGVSLISVLKWRLLSFRYSSFLFGFLKLRVYFLFVILCSLSTASLSSEIDPYSGIYRGDSAYIIIKNHNNRYFGSASSGSVELFIYDDGKFRAKDITIDITGYFEDKIEGRYQKKMVSLFGVHSVYERVDLPQDEFIPVLYGSDKQMTNFSSSDIDVCDDSYPASSLNNTTDKYENIDALISKVEKGRNVYKNIDSLLILKDGQLVVERYFNGWNADEPHMIQSVSKSLTSLLVGSAIKENKIVDVKQTLPLLLPDYKKYLHDGKEKITLQNLLTMSAGLYWNEWDTSYSNPENIRHKEIFSEDSVAFTLKQPLVENPGDRFNYSGGFVSVVGEVISQATNQSPMSEYTKEGPLSALCFKNAYWLKQNDNRTNVAGGAFLRPRDMLKIGQLVLNDGNWNGKQLVDKHYLIESIEPLIDTNLTGKKYGYFWWNTTFYVNGKKYSAILAQGYGGQDIVVIKELNLVVVKTASNFNFPSLIGKIMSVHVIPEFEDYK